jgi:adenine C2-methylase RlmN of 23S rRNA A2503 and tRNA A37
MTYHTNGYDIHSSSFDKSINYSKLTSDGGMIETRFVQRLKDRFIVYISSMSGCDKACRFCHLTQTGQTMAMNLTRDQMLEQAETVLSSSAYPEATTVHYNFMARGEPMTNPMVNKHLFHDLKLAAEKRGLFPRIKISSILPTDFHAFDPTSLWDEESPAIDFYYSLYNPDPAWRKRWIPKALPPEEALAWLAKWQQVTGNRVILHWALIDGENDTEYNAREATRLENEAGLNWDFNLVRYNPANGKSKEASEDQIERFLSVLRNEVSDANRVKVIPRVGFDVKASCGMFLTPEAA